MKGSGKVHWQKSLAGGLEGWNSLSEEERAVRDLATVAAMIKSMGEKEFDELPEPKKRELSLFFWTGCCMHKEQNAFKGGNTAMMAAWKELGVKGPIILANKWNAAAVQKALSPEKGSREPTDEEIAALEASTFGGAKLCATLSISPVSTFQTRVTIDLRVMERPLVNSFLTELVVLALVSENVTKPYLEYVRTVGLNGLKLGPWHRSLVETLEKLITNPGWWLDSEQGHALCTADGKEWRRPEVVQAARSLAPELPYVSEMIVAFRVD